MNLAAKIEMRPVSARVPYASNSRTQSEDQIDLIARSISEFGWTNPILLDGKNGIVAGHARLRAARGRPPDHAAVPKRDGRYTEAGRCSKIPQAVKNPRTVEPHPMEQRQTTRRQMTRLRISRIVAALLAALAQGSYAQTAPPAAANAGFTRLLANQDFSKARVDLGCAGASQKHFWNQGLWYEKTFPPCDQISSVSEPIAGHNVLDLRWLPSQNDPYDATTIETMAGDYSQFYDFQHGYYEAIFRVSPWNIGGLWPEFWM